MVIQCNDNLYNPQNLKIKEIKYRRIINITEVPPKQVKKNELILKQLNTNPVIFNNANTLGTYLIILINILYMFLLRVLFIF